MVKKCHKCRVSYDTDEFFCKECGSILFEQKNTEKVSFLESEQKKEKPFSEQEHTETLPRQKTSFVEYIKQEASSEKFQSSSAMFIASVVLSVLCSMYTFIQTLYVYWNATVFMEGINGAAEEFISVILAVIFVVFAVLATVFMLMPCAGIRIIKRRAVSYKLEGGFTNLTALFRVKLRKAVNIINKYLAASAVIGTVCTVIIAVEIVLYVITPDSTEISYTVSGIIVFYTLCVYYALYAFSEFKNNIDNDKCRSVKKLHKAMRILTVFSAVKTVNAAVMLIYNVLFSAGHGRAAYILFGWYDVYTVQPVWLAGFQTAAALCSFIAVCGISLCIGNLENTLKLAEDNL